MDSSPPGASVHGLFLERRLEWVAVPLPEDLPDPGIEPVSPALQADSLPLSRWGSPSPPASKLPVPSTLSQVLLLGESQA